jgi:hypothetical protein
MKFRLLVHLPDAQKNAQSSQWGTSPGVPAPAAGLDLPEYPNAASKIPTHFFSSQTTGTPGGIPHASAPLEFPAAKG